MRIHSLNTAVNPGDGLFHGANNAEVPRRMGQASKIFQTIADTVEGRRLQACVRPEVGVGQLYQARCPRNRGRSRRWPLHAKDTYALGEGPPVLSRRPSTGNVVRRVLHHEHVDIT